MYIIYREWFDGIFCSVFLCKLLFYIAIVGERYFCVGKGALFCRFCQAKKSSIFEKKLYICRVRERINYLV